MLCNAVGAGCVHATMLRLATIRAIPAHTLASLPASSCSAQVRELQAAVRGERSQVEALAAAAQQKEAEHVAALEGLHAVSGGGGTDQPLSATETPSCLPACCGAVLFQACPLDWNGPVGLVKPAFSRSESASCGCNLQAVAEQQRGSASKDAALGALQVGTRSPCSGCVLYNLHMRGAAVLAMPLQVLSVVWRSLAGCSLFLPFICRLHACSCLLI